MPTDDTAVNPGIGIFADAGPRMQREGFAVLPAKGKAPLMAGFPEWKRAPTAAAVNKWAVRYPDADLVHVPGLSRGRSGDAIIVVDGDDDDSCSRIVELFGDTPGKVLTRRGRHFLYNDTGYQIGKVQSQKKYGLNADLKHGKSIVVAPPSRHEKDRSFTYRWDECDDTVIRDLRHSMPPRCAL
jgi:Bifunctional DNA primase/polymerase, N-terminal